MNIELIQLIRQAATSKMASDVLADLRTALRTEAERLVHSLVDDENSVTTLVLTVEQCEVLAFMACFSRAFSSIPGVSLTPAGIDAFVGRDTSNDQATLAKLGLIDGFQLH